MKKFFTTAAALSVMATSAMAQDGFTMDVTQGGVSYKCQPQVETINGVPSRRCVRANGGGNMFEGGLSGVSGIGLGIIGIVVLAAALSSDDDDATTGT